jgi:hypothetical protein
MKKIFILLIVCVLITSCSNNRSVNVTPSPTLTPTLYTERSGNQTKYFMKDIINNTSLIPEYMAVAYQKYVSALKELNSSATIDSMVSIVDNYKSIKLNINDYIIRFFADTDRPHQKHWTIEFNTDNVSLLKEVFAATFMVTDETMDIETAKNNSQKLSNSFSTVSISDVFDSGDFYVYTVGDYDNIFNKPHYYCYVICKDNVKMSEQERSEYSKLDYDTAKNGIMNNGMKNIVHGRVKTMTLSSSPSYGGQSFIVVDDDKNEYEIHSRYSTIPHKFDIGDTYNFYGIVEGDDTTSPAEMSLTDFY